MCVKCDVFVNVANHFSPLPLCLCLLVYLPVPGRTRPLRRVHPSGILFRLLPCDTQKRQTDHILTPVIQSDNMCPPVEKKGLRGELGGRKRKRDVGWEGRRDEE